MPLSANKIFNRGSWKRPDCLSVYIDQEDVQADNASCTMAKIEKIKAAVEEIKAEIPRLIAALEHDITVKMEDADKSSDERASVGAEVHGIQKTVLEKLDFISQQYFEQVNRQYGDS